MRVPTNRFFRFTSDLIIHDLPVISDFRPTKDNLRFSFNTHRSNPIGKWLTFPLLLGIIYVHRPSKLLAVIPNLTHGALIRTVCPRMGCTSLSSTPPNVLAPIPEHTTIASGRADRPGTNAPSMICWMCCTDARMYLPPVDVKVS